MLSKEEEQEVQEAKATLQKIRTAIPELCSKIGEIDQSVLEFIVRDPNNIPPTSDIVRAHPTVLNNPKLAYNVVELYKVFNFKSQIIPKDKVYYIIYNEVQELIIPQALSEVRASLLDTTSISEISTSTLDTTMGTNSSSLGTNGSVLHGTPDYCEL